MSGRISDDKSPEEMLEALVPLANAAFEEVKRSRALITRLQALVDSAHETKRLGLPNVISPDEWVRRIESLLAAHDAQQAEGNRP